MPRKGAWYPVVGEASAERLVLQIAGRKVAIPKRLLEMRTRRPERFTVVYLPRNQLNQARENFGTRYAVCPLCSGRVELSGQPERLRCRSCNHIGEVAWWETG